ncbi:hypothetical protein [Paenibacillus sp. 1P07SE]|uniref:hypothetical protein n=1 Tax=Paenibacillus sp. 1P07SE TaxID=3132209 RepID=UPI0039A50995
MSTWQGIWLIVKHELRNERLGLLLSFLFFNYTSFIMIAVIHDASPFDGYTAWIENFLFLSLIPIFGFTLSRTMMRVWSEDTYTYRLADLRSMPITSRQIAGSRVLQFIIYFTAGWFYFFTLSYILVGWVRGMGFLAFAGFALMWYAYGAAVGSAYLMFELGVKGRQYMFATLVFMAVFGLVTYGLHRAGIGLLQESAAMMMQGAWWLPTVLLLTAAALVRLIYTIIQRRIENRNLFH